MTLMTFQDVWYNRVLKTDRLTLVSIPASSVLSRDMRTRSIYVRIDSAAIHDCHFLHFKNLKGEYYGFIDESFTKRSA